MSPCPPTGWSLCLRRNAAPSATMFFSSLMFIYLYLLNNVDSNVLSVLNIHYTAFLTRGTADSSFLV